MMSTTPLAFARLTIDSLNGLSNNFGTADMTSILKRAYWSFFSLQQLGSSA